MFRPSDELYGRLELWLQSITQRENSLQKILSSLALFKKQGPNRPTYTWPPCRLEMDAILRDEPIELTVNLLDGDDNLTYQIDESTTVLKVMEQIWQEKNFAKEPDV